MMAEHSIIILLLLRLTLEWRIANQFKKQRDQLWILYWAEIEKAIKLRRAEDGQATESDEVCQKEEQGRGL